MSVTEKTGEVVATFPVTDDHEVMLVTDQGKMIRTPIHDVRFTGRSAQGVTIFKVAKGEKVVSVAGLVQEDDDDAADVDNALENTANEQVVSEDIAESDTDLSENDVQ